MVAGAVCCFHGRASGDSNTDWFCRRHYCNGHNHSCKQQEEEIVFFKPIAKLV
jgi:hypothetical protein